MSVYVMDFRVKSRDGTGYWLLKVGQTKKTATRRMWSLMNSIVFSGLECTAWRLSSWCEDTHDDDDGLEEAGLFMANEAVQAGRLEKVPTRREWFRFPDSVGDHYPENPLWGTEAAR